MAKFSKVLLISFPFLLCSPILKTDEILFQKSAIKTEKKSLDFLTDNYFRQYDQFDRHAKRKIQQQIKEWNPHIKNWNTINNRVNILVYKKKTIIDGSIGKSFNSFSNEFMNHNATSMFLKINLDYNFKYWSSVGVHGLFQKFNYYENQAQSTKKSNCLTYGLSYKYILKNSPNFSIRGIIENNSFAHYALLNSDRSLIMPIEMDAHLQPAKTEIIYLGGGIEHNGQFPELLPNKSFIKVYKSILGKVKSTNSSDSEDAEAMKLEIGFRQFLYRETWGELTYQKTFLDTASSPDLAYSTISANLGFTY